MTDIYDEIREAMATGEKSRYRIAKETEISQSALSLFVHGKRGLSGDRLERIAKSLGYSITLTEQKEER